MNRTMKESRIEWLGEVPDNWKLKRAKGLFVQRTSKGNQNPVLLSSTQKQGMMPQHLLEGVVQTSADTDLQLFKTVHINDYVISLRSFQGGFEKSSYEGVCSPAYQVFYNRENIDYNYYWLLFKCVGFISKINSLTVGIREGKNIQYKDFANMYLPFPPVPEQQAIADFLDKKCGEIDEMIVLQEKIIEELKAYKQSIITEAVTKGLNPDVQMKDSGIEWIGQIPEHWKIAPFKSMYSLGKGLGITKADLVPQGIPVISYGQIHSKINTGTSISDDLIRYVPEQYLEGNSEALVHIGDLIFADTSEDLDGCGNCVYIDREGTIFAGYHTIIAKNLPTEHNNYFSYLFKTDCWRKQIRSVVNGVKLYSIPQKTLSSTTIIIPPIEEQRAIGDYLDEQITDINSLISIKQSKIEELKEYKKSIIYECVTGKKDVI